MTGYFDLRNARDCLEDFRRKLADFKSDNLNVDKATACAEACWSVVEWVGPEILAPMNERKQLDQFKRDRLAECQSLAYVRDLTDKRKHRILERKSVVVKSEENHIGDYDPRDFSRDFDISCLVIITADSQRFYIEDVFNECLTYWDKYFYKSNL